MSPVTHFLTGWLVANCARLNRRERAAITLAGVVPDLDGLGAIAEILTRHSTRPLAWFSLYHHQLHNLAFGLLVAAVSFAVATRRWVVASLAFLSFHLHLLEDLVGSRGPDGYEWPVSYLAPFSQAEFAWRGQWALNAWPNYVVTGTLLLMTLYLAWWKGYSPLEMISSRADEVLVATLRKRCPRPESPTPLNGKN